MQPTAEREQCVGMQRAVGVQTTATERGELWEGVPPPARCAGPRRGVARNAVRAIADQQVRADGWCSAEERGPVRPAWRPDAERRAGLVSLQCAGDRALLHVGRQRIRPPGAVVCRRDRHTSGAEGTSQAASTRADFQPRFRQSFQDARKGRDKLHGGQMIDALCPANSDESGAGDWIGEAGIEHGVCRQRMSGEPRDPIAPGDVIGDARRGK